jgi:hypothetical protein
MTLSPCDAGPSQDSRVTNKRRGWVPKGELSKSKTIFARGKRYTTIAAMCSTGLIATLTFEGASDKATFMTFIAEQVVSAVSRWAIRVLQRSEGEAFRWRTIELHAVGPSERRPTAGHVDYACC